MLISVIILPSNQDYEIKKKKIKVSWYHPNDQGEIRRVYIKKEKEKKSMLTSLPHIPTKEHILMGCLSI